MSMNRDAGKLFNEPDRKPSTDGVTTGILPDRDIAKLIDGGRISAEGGVDGSQIQPASATHWATLKPRVVTAGVPMRRPEVTNGDCGSLGTAFLLTVI